MQGFENRLDKPCRLELGGGDLFNGSTSSADCVHRIVWATARSAGPDEEPCTAFRCFRASPLRILVVAAYTQPLRRIRKGEARKQRKAAQDPSSGPAECAVAHTFLCA